MYEMQKALDARIIKEKGLEGKDLLPNTVLALQVEIAELANEWRGFKHWSNQQEPKNGYAAKIDCDKCSGKGFWFDGGRVHCGKCGTTGKVLNPLLEEYIDCLHFFLSIARQLDFSEDVLYAPGPDEELEGSTAHVFTEIIYQVSVVGLAKAEQREMAFKLGLWIFYSLGQQRLGFSFEQIAEAYATKNKVNHERQENGY